MRNATTLFLVAFATVLSTLTSTTTAQVGDSPWCRVYMTSCEDLRKTNCDAKVPNNDRNLTWITAHCSTVTSSTGVCRYFSPDCSCSYTNVADMNRTVMVPLGPAALDQTQLQTNNGCIAANETSTPTASTTGTTTTGTPSGSTSTLSAAPTASMVPSMAAGDSKKPMAVSLATINIAILIALFF